MSSISDESTSKQNQLSEIYADICNNSSKLYNGANSSNFVNSYKDKVKVLVSDISNFKSMLKTAYKAASFLETANKYNEDIKTYKNNISSYKSQIASYEKKVTENEKYVDEINKLNKKIDEYTNKITYLNSEYNYLMNKVKSMISDY